MSNIYLGFGDCWLVNLLSNWWEVSSSGSSEETALALSGASAELLLEDSQIVEVDADVVLLLVEDVFDVGALDHCNAPFGGQNRWEWQNGIAILVIFIV